MIHIKIKVGNEMNLGGNVVYMIFTKDSAIIEKNCAPQVSEHSSLWLDYSSPLHGAAVLYCRPYLYIYLNKSLHSQLCVVHREIKPRAVLCGRQEGAATYRGET